MSRNIIDTNQYFKSFVLNDKHRKPLFADMTENRFSMHPATGAKQKNLTSG